MKKTNKGFTLIELLVVIAIIGILASVVLVSLNAARQKGKDVKVISDIQGIRTSLESGFNGIKYTDLVNGATTTGPDIANINLLTDDLFAQGSTFVLITNSIGGNVTKYAIAGQLISDPAHFFCIANDGSTSQATDTPSSTTC